MVFPAGGLFRNLLLKMPTGTLCALLQSGKRNKKSVEENNEILKDLNVKRQGGKMRQAYKMKGMNKK